MPVLTIASRKGGTGKSTTSVAIASLLDAEGVDIGLLDTDPNQGAYRWATQKYGGTTLKAYAESDTEKLAELLPTLAARHAVLIVDTAGFGNQAATVAMAGADGVLVPVTQARVMWSRPDGQSGLSKAWQKWLVDRSRCGFYQTVFGATQR